MTKEELKEELEKLDCLPSGLGENEPTEDMYAKSDVLKLLYEITQKILNE